MEKITTRIGFIGPSAAKVDRTKSEDIKWLAEVLQMSSKRAANIRKELDYNGNNTIYVILNHVQLARYLARRQVDGLNKYWAYPYVTEYLEHDPGNERHPVELRPTYRRHAENVDC